MKFTAITTAVATALALALPGTADARDLRIASGAPPPHPAKSHMYT